jgi:hypothetical protein
LIRRWRHVEHPDLVFEWNLFFRSVLEAMCVEEDIASVRHVTGVRTLDEAVPGNGETLRHLAEVSDFGLVG